MFFHLPNYSLNCKVCLLPRPTPFVTDKLSAIYLSVCGPTPFEAKPHQSVSPYSWTFRFLKQRNPATPSVISTVLIVPTHSPNRSRVNFPAAPPVKTRA